MKKINIFLAGFIFLQTISVLIPQQGLSQTKVNWKWAKQSNCFAEMNPCEDARHHFTDTEIDNLDDATVVVGEFSGYFSTDNQDVVSDYSNPASARIEGLVARYNRIGKNIWTNKIADNNPDENGFVQCRGVAIDNQGSIYVTGYTSANVTFFGYNVLGLPVVLPKVGAAQYNGFVVKYDRKGKLQHVRLDDTKIYNDVAVSPIIDQGGQGNSGGDIYLTGAYDYTSPAHLDTYTLVATEEEQFLMVKLNSSFDVLWARGSYGWSEGTQIALDATNNAVYALGIYDEDVMIIPHSVSTPMLNMGSKFYTRINASTGVTVWLKSITANLNQSNPDLDLFSEENEFVNGDMTLDNEGNLYIVGSFSGLSVDIAGLQIVNNAAGNVGSYVFKASGATGNPFWSEALVADDDRNVFPESVVWYGNQIYVGAYEKDLMNHLSSFLAFATSNNGAFFHYYYEFNNSTENIISAMYLNPQNGNVAIVGDYEGNNLRLGGPINLGNTLLIDGVIGNEPFVFQSRTEAGEGWVGRFNKIFDPGWSPILIEETPSNIAVKVSPNPVSTGENINFTITSETEEHLNISLMDIKGSIVNQGEYDVKEGKNNFNFSTSNLKTGVYLLKTKGNSFSKTQKIIIK